jgi:PAS domain S-box-containing protein
MQTANGTQEPSPTIDLAQQEDLLGILFDRMPMGIAVFDREMRLQRCNPTWADYIQRYTPSSAEQVVPGISLFELAPGSRESIMPLIERVLAGETIRHNALRSESSGIVSYWDVVFTPLMQDGRVTGILDVVTDATDRIKADQELETALEELCQREERLALVMQATNDGIWDWDLKTDAVYFSPRWKGMLGYQEQEIENRFKEWERRVHPDDLPRAMALLEDFCQGRAATFNLEHRLQHKDGSYRWILARGGLVQDAEGRPCRMVGSHVDITDKKRTEEQLYHQIAFDNLITTISTHFINLPPEEVDAGINRALRELGQFAEVDRSYVFLFSADGKVMDNTHEWCAEGIEPQIEHMQAVPVDELPWSSTILQEGEVLHIPRVTDLPEEAAAEKQEFQRQGIRSLMAVPMVYLGNTIGFLGFDSVRAEKAWSEASIKLLNMAGEILVNALEHKRAQAIQAGQRQFLELLATGGTLSETLHALVRLIEEQWPGMLGLVLLLDRDAGQLHYGAAVSLPQDYLDSIEGLEIGPMVGSCGTSSYLGQRVIVEDIATDPRWDGLRDLAVTYGLGACWSEPVISSKGEVIGTFAMYYGHRRGPTAAELQTIETAAHLVRIAIEHHEAGEALRESQRTLATLMSNLPGMAYRSKGDRERTMTFVSEGGLALTGYSPSDLVGGERLTYGQLIHVEDRKVVWQEIQTAVEAERPFHLTYRILTANGHEKWIWEQGCGVFSPEDELLSLEGFATDITERVMAQQNLEQRVAERTLELSTLLAVSRKVTSTLELEPLLGTILDELRTVLDCTGTSILSIDGDDLVVRAYRGPISAAEASKIRLPLSRASVNYEVIQRREPVIVSDTRADTRLARLFRQTAGDQLDDAYGYIRSWMGVPLLVKDRLLGMLTLDHRQPDFYSAEDLELVTTFANQVAVAIDNARLYVEERERRQEAQRGRRVAEGLRDVLAILNSNRPLDEVLDFIAAQATRLMGAGASTIFHVQPQEGKVTVEASHGLPKVLSGKKRTTRIFDGYADRAILDRRPYAIPDLLAYLDVLETPEGDRLDQGERDWRESMARAPKQIQAMLAVPLVVSDVVYGSIVYYYPEPQTFAEEDIRLGVSWADQAALAIENASLRARVEETAAAAERSRLARDLHDAVTQTLFSASLIAEVLPRLWERNPAEAQRRLAELRELTRGALAEMRTLLLELRPSALMEADMGDLLRQLAESITGRARIPVTVTMEGTCGTSPEIKVALYRIAQEALNNTAKHSDAEQVAVTLRCTSDVVELSVRDNGRGFDVESVPPDHLGIGIMRERAEAVGAELRIESTIGQGTEITAVLSIEQPELVSR